jgi:molecular chaperone HtpG
LERILAEHGQIKTRAAPVLELNPTHDLIKALAGKAAGGGASAALDDAAVILYGEAKILDGEMPDDPGDHAARVGRLIERGLG